MSSDWSYYKMALAAASAFLILFFLYGLGIALTQLFSGEFVVRAWVFSAFWWFINFLYFLLLAALAVIGVAGVFAVVSSLGMLIVAALIGGSSALASFILKTSGQHSEDIKNLLTNIVRKNTKTMSIGILFLVVQALIWTPDSKGLTDEIGRIKLIASFYTIGLYLIIVIFMFGQRNQKLIATSLTFILVVPTVLLLSLQVSMTDIATVFQKLGEVSAGASYAGASGYNLDAFLLALLAFFFLASILVPLAFRKIRNEVQEPTPA